MRRVSWGDRQPGDIFLSALSSILGTGIRDAELAMHPGAPKDFVPSHAGVIGFAGTVVEAWLDLHQNSVAAINPDSKYAPFVSQGLVEVWRPDKASPDALAQYIKLYGPEAYGVLNLVGFEWVAFVKLLTGRDVENPVEISQVCSQGAGDYLTVNYAYTGAERWVLGINVPNLDPLQLRLDCLAEIS